LPLNLLFPWLQWTGRNIKFAISNFLTSPESAENCTEIFSLLTNIEWPISALWKGNSNGK